MLRFRFLAHIMAGRYNRAHENKFIASCRTFLAASDDRPFINERLYERFKNFLTRIVLNYTTATAYEVRFIGSVAFAYQDMISDILEKTRHESRTVYAEPDGTGRISPLKSISKFMIDTHCHIYFYHFEEDLQKVLDRAANAGINHIFMPAMNFDSLADMAPLEHPDITFHAMAGIHPTEINEGVRCTEQELCDYCSKTEIIGVGETGLDYYWSDEYKKEQQENLRIHCRVSKKVNKPINLHNRESTTDLLAIIEEEQDGNLTGVWHCFNGSVDEGKRAIDLGLHLGIGGVLTFKNAGVDETVAQLPLGKMVLETDAPYLTPSPHRGERNEPAFVPFVAEKLAAVQNVPLDKVIAKTDDNALSLFRISSA